MNYEFPYITNIAEILPAIQDRPEFVVAERPGYTVVNYNVNLADTFPPIKVAGGSKKMREERELHNKLRRECRGIIFCSETGDILRRPYHKFFNVNEKDETQDHVIDLSRDHYVLDKLDGSMIVPFKVGDRMIWGTKMGDTDVAKPVQDFVATRPNYQIFAECMISIGYSPIFEWCSRKQRIVLDYGQEDSLILTAIRGIKGGTYFKQWELDDYGVGHDIPVVKAFGERSDMKELIATARSLEDVEGYVVRFDDGHMVKLKCDWYVQIHKAKDAILQDRNIVEMILNNTIDDVKAHLPQEDRDSLQVFESNLSAAIKKRVDMIKIDVAFFKAKKIDRKDFALKYAAQFDANTKTIIFSLWDDEDTLGVHDAVIKVITKNLGKNVNWDTLKDQWFSDLHPYNQR